METSASNAASGMPVAYSTLMTSLVKVKDEPLAESGEWNHLARIILPPFQGRDLTMETVWITVDDTLQEEVSQLATVLSSPSPVSTPTVQISILSLVAAQEPAQTATTPSPSPTSPPNIATQLGADPPAFDPANPCPPNTDPVDQQVSSYKECQETIAPGGICCIPDAAFHSNTSRTSASSTVAPGTPAFSSSASSSSTSLASSAPPPSTSSIPAPTLSAAPSPTPPTASALATALSSPLSPIPTDLTTSHTKLNILPILVPCALAAIGIIVFAIWCAIWRGRDKRHRPTPSPPHAGPQIVDGQKVFEAGNFATAAAFAPGIEEMQTKKRILEGEGKEEGRRGWAKGGYRKYRNSRAPGSGLLEGRKA